MNKQKPSRRSRLVRKWDGTPLVEVDPSGESATDNTGPSQRFPEDRTPERKELTFDIERNEELTDTMDR